MVGAVIDLRNCLDLTNRDDIELVRVFHKSFIDIQKRGDLPIPENQSVRGSRNQDRVLRFLDCAVFRHLHENIDELAKEGLGIESFDTVRGIFVEGGKAYPGSGIHRKSHVQIAVRNLACIKGIFFPL